VVTVFPARPTVIYLDALLVTSGNYRNISSYPTNTVTVKWVRPGSRDAEPIPPDVLFHKKADESQLTKD
jgi:hypothetical protein